MIITNDSLSFVIIVCTAVVWIMAHATSGTVGNSSITRHWSILLYFNVINPKLVKNNAGMALAIHLTAIDNKRFTQ